MINTGDKLLCTIGNDCYLAGEIYTVGRFVNKKYFELFTGCDDECWYGTVDEEGIHVSFNSIYNDQSDAWFEKIELYDCDYECV